MKSIFSTFASFNMDTNPTPSASNSIVAELWDTYLTQIASDPEMEPKMFMELVQLLPISCLKHFYFLSWDSLIIMSHIED